MKRRALWRSWTNDLSGEKFLSHCSLRSVGMRHCLQEESAEESLLPSRPSLPNPPHPELDWTELGLVWPHVDKGRRRDKMAPGLPSSAVIHGSRQFPPRILSLGGRSYLCSPLLCWRFLALVPTRLHQRQCHGNSSVFRWPLHLVVQTKCVDFQRDNTSF